jgi:maternal-effect protein exuperantia
VVIQPPTPEAKVESDAPPAVITTQPAQPMPEHDDSIAVVMWEATVTGRRLIDEMVNLGSFYVAQ